LVAWASVFIFLCSFPWFQGWAKSFIASNISSELTKLGQQVNTVQETTTAMHTQLENHQTEIDKHQKELNEIQAKIREAESNVFSQQSDITNQFQQISMVQSNLNDAQTNLLVQQEKLTNVESLVNSLFSNTEDEHFSATATNKFILLQIGGHQLCIFRLNAVPIANTIQSICKSTMGQFPLIPPMGQVRNILYTRFSSGAHEVLEFHFRYIKDVRENRLVQNMAIVGTNNLVSFDGVPVDVSNF
jgi:DNA gyrase/topoisomerase IV subunit A